MACDRSHRERGRFATACRTDLAVSPHGTLNGAIRSDENDAAFKTDTRCGNVKKAKKADACSVVAADVDPETSPSPPLMRADSDSPGWFKAMSPRYGGSLW